MRILQISGMIAVTFHTLWGQTSGPAFEVASVKPAGPQGGSLGTGLYTYPGGMVRAANCPLDYLIEQAFDIQPFQISGGPSWMHQDRFDIEAKPPADSKSSKSNPNNPKLPPNGEQRLMLQALLADRFQMKWRRETKEGPVYFLVKSGKKLELREPKNKEEYPWAGSAGGGPPFSAGIEGMNISMAQLAARLSKPLGKPVLDRTGLEGSFDFRFAHSPGNESSDILPFPVGGPVWRDVRPDDRAVLISEIVASVQGLGLKLEAGRGPIEMLVIEHAEKPGSN